MPTIMRSRETDMGLALRNGAFVVLVLSGCGLPAEHATDADDEARIQAVLEAQAKAWNSGDLEGFLRDYDASADMTFTSGGDLIEGRAALLERYRRRYPAGQSGLLSFAELRFTRLAPDCYLVLGTWTLEQLAEHPHGRFSLVFRRAADGWKILHDHSSSAGG